MRIIVTQTGNDVIREMNKEFEKEQEAKKENEKFKSLEKYRLATISNKADLNNSYLTTSANSHGTHNTKSITIKQKKINIPKNISEKYNFNHEVTPNFNKDSKAENVFRKIEIENGFYYNSELPLIRESYKIKEIIPKNVFSNMEKEIKSKIDLKNKLMKIDENKFRTPFLSSKKNIQEIQKKAEKKINSQKLNLINYLNNKKQISEKFIKALSTYDEERLNKLNRVCQKIIHAEEKERLFKSIIDSKILEARMKESEEYKNTLIQFENNLQNEQNIIKLNERPVDDKERFYWIHNEFTEYWKKHNLNVLSSPKLRKLASLQNSIDESTSPRIITSETLTNTSPRLIK